MQFRTAFDNNHIVYSAPRIHAELADAGVRVGRKRVARLMRQAEIVGCHRRKWSLSWMSASRHSHLVDRPCPARTAR